MGDYIVQQDDLNMKDYIGEYLKRSFPGHRSTITIPKYIDIFFTFTEFGKYLHQYFTRFTDIEYMLGLDNTSVFNKIKAKFQEKNISCLAAANELFSLVTKFLNPNDKKSLAKMTFGFGTSGNYAKMLKMAQEENTHASNDELKEIVDSQIKFMVEFSKKILEMEFKLTTTTGQMEKLGLQTTYNKNSIEDLIGYKKLQVLLNETEQEAQAATAPHAYAGEDEHELEDQDAHLGGSRRHTRHRRHRHSLRSRKLIKRSKKGKKIMKQPTKNRRVNIRKQKNKKTKSRK